jgi:hypothetical protein
LLKWVRWDCGAHNLNVVGSNPTPQPTLPQQNQKGGGQRWGIVSPIKQLPVPTDDVLSEQPYQVIQRHLRRANFDRDGNKRTAYSLHHTYTACDSWRGRTSTRLPRTTAQFDLRGAELLDHVNAGGEEAHMGSLSRGLALDFLGGRLAFLASYRALGSLAFAPPLGRHALWVLGDKGNKQRRSSNGSTLRKSALVT